MELYELDMMSLGIPRVTQLWFHASIFGTFHQARLQWKNTNQKLQIFMKPNSGYAIITHVWIHNSQKYKAK